MRLPEELLAAIQREIERTDQRGLVQASKDLTRHYQAADFSAPAIKTALHRAAYLLVRVPATYAASARVFAEIRRLAPQAGIASMLDLGAGPGTAIFAAAQIFPDLRRVQLVESSRDWLQLGKRLAADSSSSVLTQAQWKQHDLRAEFEFPPHDLVVISYALGELPETARQTLVSRAWKWTSKFLVIIEPGTTRGFGAILAARSTLIADGAHILAPCPHRDPCPMAGTSDWCHFAERVERTSQHRRLKAAALGYEDEKFSYIVASRQAIQPATTRIVRHPKKLRGHVQLTLCSKSGIETRTVARSSKEVYKQARKAEWGDAWDE